MMFRPIGTSSHLSITTVPSLSLRLLVCSPKGSRTCCTPWSVFQDGSDEAVHIPAALVHNFFAISLMPVFSFRWSLPPILGCNPKQPDSFGTDLVFSGAPAHWALTLSDPPFQDDWGRHVRQNWPYRLQFASASTRDLSYSRFARRY